MKLIRRIDHKVNRDQYVSRDSYLSDRYIIEANEVTIESCLSHNKEVYVAETNIELNEEDIKKVDEILENLGRQLTSSYNKDSFILFTKTSTVAFYKLLNGEETVTYKNNNAANEAINSIMNMVKENYKDAIDSHVNKIDCIRKGETTYTPGVRYEYRTIRREDFEEIDYFKEPKVKLLGRNYKNL